MKLLLDQNLSPRLCEALADMCEEVTHVRNLGLAIAPDREVWDYAARNGFAIVTKDADFRQRSFVLGHPPKVIWIRVGNCSTRRVAQLLRDRADRIGEFIAMPTRHFWRYPDAAQAPSTNPLFRSLRSICVSPAPRPNRPSHSV